MTSHKNLPDIVDRLRGKATDCHASEEPLYLEAAAELTRLRAQRSEEARPSWDEAREAAAKVAEALGTELRGRGPYLGPYDEGGAIAAETIAESIRALPRPSAPAEDGEETIAFYKMRLEAAHEALEILRSNAPEDGEGVREALEEFVGAAMYDAMMDGPRFKGWNRSQLDRALEKGKAALSPLHEGKLREGKK